MSSLPKPFAGLKMMQTIYIVLISAGSPRLCFADSEDRMKHVEKTKVNDHVFPKDLIFPGRNRLRSTRLGGQGDKRKGNSGS